MSGKYHKVPKIKGYTRDEIISMYKSKILCDMNWTKSALIKLGDYQTQYELKKNKTKELNEYGFDQCDSPILTRAYKNIDKLTLAHYRKLAPKLMKYAAQLASVSDPKKLKYQLDKYYNLNKPDASPDEIMKVGK